MRVLLLAALFWGCGTTLAQEASSSFVVPETRLGSDDTVETPTYGRRAKGKTPYQVEKLDGQKIQSQQMARSAPEVLKETTSVLVQKTAQGQGSPFIRGFTGFRTLTLIDGIRVNNSVWREGPNQYLSTVDPAMASQVELVKGPSSVLYGSDAIGGTLNFLTDNLDDGKSRTVGRYQYGTSDLRQIYRLEHRQADGDTRYTVGGSYRSFGDVVAGGDLGRQPYTGYDEYAGDVKIVSRLSPGDEVILVLQKHQQNQVPRTHKTIFAKSYEGTSIGSEKKRELDQGRELGYVRWKAREKGRLQNISLTGFWHHHTEEQFRIKSNDESDRQGFDLGAVGLMGSFGLATSVGTWTLGLEAVDETVDSYKTSYNADGSFKSRSIQGPVGDEAKYLSAAAFVQHEASVWDATTLITGVRYSHHSAQVDRYEDPVTSLPAKMDKDFGAAVGSLRVQYQFNDASALFGGVSQGFRAPNLSDLTRLDEARTNEIETPAPNLEAEKFLSYELGYRFGREDLRFEASAYYTDIKEMIIRRPTGVVISGDNEVTKANAGNGFVQGAELTVRKKINKWEVGFGSSWMDGEVDTYPTSANVIAREPMSRLMPFTTMVSLLHRPHEDVWLEIFVTQVSKQDKLSTSDKSDTSRIPPGGTPGYTLVTLRGGHSFGKHLRVSAAVENLGDENYRVHGSGSNEPGRNFLLGLEGTF
ncbi:MAG: TonB-dependent receptor [Bdellovibrionaceae bacterium]|nr:TonB-dependent receptor [Bdellovibrionales bacterium]MCB9085942.1 TonB-dependent receptor [Pseudobdellovibrionaceae bacterium]